MRRVRRRFVGSAEGLESRALLSTLARVTPRSGAEVRAERAPRSPRVAVNRVFHAFALDYSVERKTFYDEFRKANADTTSLRSAFELYTRQMVEKLASRLDRVLIRYQPSHDQHGATFAYANGVRFLATRNINGRSDARPGEYARRTLGRDLIEAIPPAKAPTSTLDFYYTAQDSAIETARLAYQSGLNGLRLSLASGKS